MRTVSPAEAAVLAALTRTTTYRVKIANGSGTMVDLSSWVEHVSPDQDQDQPVAGASIELTRASGVLQTLSPFRTDSLLNRLDDGTTYAPQIDLVRAITIEIAVTAIGVLPSGSDFKPMLEGTTSTVALASNPIMVECRDKGGLLVDRWVETPRQYGSLAGVAMETVMQSILDDNLGAGVVSLYTPTSPSYLIGGAVPTGTAPGYQQQAEPIMDAMVALAQLPGWDVRYKWDNGTSQFRFTLSEPPRTKTVPDYTFGPKDYFDVTQLELSETDIRNVVIVEYTDVNQQGNRRTITVFDSVSITKYRRRPLLITEAPSSPINTAAEATTLANAALADLKDPKAAMEIALPFFWPAEIGDLYRFSSNGVHFNTDQDLAVVSFVHDLSPGKHETRLRVRGKPSGQYLTWLDRGVLIGPAGVVANSPRPIIEFLDGEVDDTLWNIRFDAIEGSGGGGSNLVYTITSKKSFAAETSIATGDQSTLPRDLAIARDPKYEKVITFTVTDMATRLSAADTITMPSQRPEVSTTGNVLRARPLDDGNYSAQAVDFGGAQLHESVSQQSGGTAKNLAVGRYAISTGTHGQSVSFPSNYQNPPAVNILGGISYEPASVWSTNPNSLPGALAPAAARQIDEVVAYNVTTSGASLRARLRQASSSTSRSDAYAAGAITTNGGTKEVTTANAPANDDSYTSDYTYDFEVSGVPGKTGSISATVCHDYWNGSSWIQVASATYTDSDSDGDGSVIISGSDTLPGVVSGLTATSKFRIRLVVNASSGAGTRTYSVDPGNCVYTTTTGDQYASKTPTGLGITLSVEVLGAS